MDKQNITLSIDKEILQEVKMLAVKQNTSISALMTRHLEDIVAREERYPSASQDHLRLLDEMHDHGTNGSIDWSWDDLHAR